MDMEVDAVGSFCCLAYIDPGSGTLVLQVLVASMLGGLFSIGAFLRKFWPRAGQHTAPETSAASDELASP